MSYVIIQPPFTLDFSEMSKKELKEYFRWFFEVLPLRIDELTKVVRESPGFETWQPDHNPNSLDTLGKWFSTQVEIRPRTPDEIQEIENRLTFPIEIPSEELTNRTFSLAMDIGMYFSQVFIRNYPSLRWEQQFGRKNDANYGQPVLVGFGRTPLNPVRIVVTIAYGLASKSRTEKELREAYNYWLEKIL